MYAGCMPLSLVHAFSVQTNTCPVSSSLPAFALRVPLCNAAIVQIAQLNRIISKPVW